ncbi:hypothetical protein EPI10_025502 [Gossypium australe]|uniref:Uncharacterized protein n=1 Tax=Gossypium australe TaxID=47621 RepID=A0A5B6W2F4_9ROSI|nr:hypothetical protein EPI10_025502 [Gossypium australe]
MADDDMKLQQPVDENSVPDIPEPETEGIPEDSSSEARDPIPTPPLSSARRDIWREQQWKDILSKEERTQHCSRCQEIGHAHIHCPYPFYTKHFPCQWSGDLQKGNTDAVAVVDVDTTAALVMDLLDYSEQFI